MTRPYKTGTKHHRTKSSDKIEINKDKIDRANDDIMRAELFIPDAKGRCLRAGMIAIAAELGKNGQLASFDHLHDKYDLGRSCITKIQVRMSRAGFIEKRQGYWRLSSRFERTLQRLAEQWQAMCQPPITEDEKQRKILFVEMAKGGAKE